MPTNLPDLRHLWKQNHEGQGLAWWCPDCLLSSPTPYDALCPDRIQAALAEAREQGRREERAIHAKRLHRLHQHAAKTLAEIGSMRVCGRKVAPMILWQKLEPVVFSLRSAVAAASKDPDHG